MPVRSLHVAVGLATILTSTAARAGAITANDITTVALGREGVQLGLTPAGRAALKAITSTPGLLAVVIDQRVVQQLRVDTRVDSELVFIPATPRDVGGDARKATLLAVSALHKEIIVAVAARRVTHRCIDPAE